MAFAVKDYNNKQTERNALKSGEIVQTRKQLISIKALFTQSFRLYTKKIGYFFIMSFGFFVSVYWFFVSFFGLLAHWILCAKGNCGSEEYLIWGILSIVSFLNLLIVGSWLIACIIRTIQNIYLNESFKFKSILIAGWKKTGKVIFVALLVIFIGIADLVLKLIFRQFVSVPVLLLLKFGYLLFYIWLGVVLNIAVCEDIGIIRSFKKSFILLKGSFWRVLSRSFVLWLIYMPLFVVSSALFFVPVVLILHFVLVYFYLIYKNLDQKVHL